MAQKVIFDTQPDLMYMTCTPWIIILVTYMNIPMYPFLPYNSTPKGYIHVGIKNSWSYGKKGDYVIILELLAPVI